MAEGLTKSKSLEELYLWNCRFEGSASCSTMNSLLTSASNLCILRIDGCKFLNGEGNVVVLELSAADAKSMIEPKLQATAMHTLCAVLSIVH